MLKHYSPQIKEDAIHRYRKGEKVKDIAPLLGATEVTVYKWIKTAKNLEEKKKPKVKLRKKPTYTEITMEPTKLPISTQTVVIVTQTENIKNLLEVLK